MNWTELHNIDQLLTLEINSWNSFITDPVWQFFSDKLVWAPMYAAIIALLIWKLGWKRVGSTGKNDEHQKHKIYFINDTYPCIFSNFSLFKIKIIMYLGFITCVK